MAEWSRYTVNRQAFLEWVQLTLKDLDNKDTEQRWASALNDNLILAPHHGTSLAYISIDSVKDWYHSHAYRLKYFDLLRLLKYWEQHAEFWNTTESDCGVTSTFADPHKMGLLITLMDLADGLSQNFDRHREGIYCQLEAELYSSLTPFEAAILLASNSRILKPSILQIFKKFLHGNLMLLVKMTFTRIKRDLRRLFRSIIHFLFKNMSDESDANDFLFNRYLNKNFIIDQFINHEYKRFNKAFRTPPQYKGIHC
jgi:hypothetical protein